MKIRDAFWWILSISIATPFLLFYAPQLIGANDALIVMSGSMEPEIPTGAVIFVEDPDPDSIERGEVITFRHTMSQQPGQVSLTTHRVIDVRGEYPNLEFKTKGDANEDPDPGWVNQANVYGEYMFTVPMMGYLLSWTKSFQGLLLLILVPSTLLIVSELKKVVFAFKPELETDTVEKLSPLISMVAVIGVVSISILAIQTMNVDAPGLSYTQLSIGMILILIAAMIFVHFTDSL